MNFNDIPLELFQKICEYLKAKDIGRMFQVSKNMNRLVNSSILYLLNVDLVLEYIINIK